MLTVVVIAALFRFWQLGRWPPGLYRDEAYNGLDALNVLDGRLALFFPANNGREPLYIYLVAVAVALLGPTALAVRLPAAIVGTLATLPTYALGRAWFGRLTGLFAAFLWAVTFWPVHLSRIGLRVVAFGPLLALAFWLGTLAYRRGAGGLWFVAGLVYGITFYTYLAARFTPLLLLLLAAYLVLTGRKGRLWSRGRSLWFVIGAALIVLPLAALIWRQPDILIGRAGQVSIFSPTVNQGDLWGALVGNVGRSLGLFFWRGDTILRHNGLLDYSAVLPQDHPAGRPVFDLLMIAPFFIGLGWCLRHWRRPPAMALLLWQLVMLGPTILAEDAPHFLRAAGVLPGAVFLPAIGLAVLWDWQRPPALLRQAVVVALLAGSAWLTARDYRAYGQQPDVAYLFEAAASELATSAAADAQNGAVWLDRRFPEGWPSIPYLLTGRAYRTYDPGEGLPPISEPAVIYAWPFASLDFIREAITLPAIVGAETGPPARGDLEPEPYPLYVRYDVRPARPDASPVANFAGQYNLYETSYTLAAPDVIRVDLLWEAAEPERQGTLPTVFVHVTGPDGLLAQDDAPPAGGNWPIGWWQSGLYLRDSRLLRLPEAFDPARHQVIVGLYRPDDGARLPVLDVDGRPAGDHVVVPPGEQE